MALIGDGEDSCDPKPMEEWMAQTDAEVCVPCSGGMIVDLYREALEGAGHAERAAELESFATNLYAASVILPGEIDIGIDMRPLGRELDQIKAEFPDLIDEFKQFDCLIQETAMTIDELEGE